MSLPLQCDIDSLRAVLGNLTDSYCRSLLIKHNNSIERAVESHFTSVHTPDPHVLPTSITNKPMKSNIKKRNRPSSSNPSAPQSINNNKRVKSRVASDNDSYSDSGSEYELNETDSDSDAYIDLAGTSSDDNKNIMSTRRSTSNRSGNRRSTVRRNISSSPDINDSPIDFDRISSSSSSSINNKSTLPWISDPSMNAVYIPQNQLTSNNTHSSSNDISSSSSSSGALYNKSLLSKLLSNRKSWRKPRPMSSDDDDDMSDGDTVPSNVVSRRRRVTKAKKNRHGVQSGGRRNRRNRNTRTISELLAEREYIGINELPDYDSDAENTLNSNTSIRQQMNKYHDNEQIQVKLNDKWFNARIDEKLNFSGAVIVSFDGWSAETRRAVPISSVAKLNTHPIYKVKDSEKPIAIWPSEVSNNVITDTNYIWDGIEWQTIGELSCMAVSETIFNGPSIKSLLCKSVPCTDNSKLQQHAIDPSFHRYIIRWLEGLEKHSGLLNGKLTYEQIKHQSDTNIQQNPIRCTDDAMMSWADLLMKKKIRSGKLFDIATDNNDDSSDSNDDDSDNDTMNNNTLDSYDGSTLPDPARSPFELYCGVSRDQSKPDKTLQDEFSALDFTVRTDYHIAAQNDAKRYNKQLKLYQKTQSSIDTPLIEQTINTHTWKPSKRCNILKKWSYWRERCNVLDVEIDGLQANAKKFCDLLYDDSLVKSRTQPLYTYMVTLHVQINQGYEGSTGKKGVAEMPWNELMMLMHPSNKQLEFMIRCAEKPMSKQFYSRIAMDALVKLAVRKSSDELHLNDYIHPPQHKSSDHTADTTWLHKAGEKASNLVHSLASRINRVKKEKQSNDTNNTIQSKLKGIKSDDPNVIGDWWECDRELYEMQYLPQSGMDDLFRELHEMTEDELSALCELSLTLYDYQKQSVIWMIQQEMQSSTLSQCVWLPMKFLHTNKSYYYSPFLHKFQLVPLSDVRGGWCAEEMGLGKTIMSLAMIQYNRRDGFRCDTVPGARPTLDSTENPSTSPSTRNNTSNNIPTTSTAESAPGIRRVDNNGNEPNTTSSTTTNNAQTKPKPKISLGKHKSTSNDNELDDEYSSELLDNIHTMIRDAPTLAKVSRTSISPSLTDTSLSTLISPSLKLTNTTATPKLSGRTGRNKIPIPEFDTDNEGRLISGATLIVCSTSLIGQWLNEMLEKSATGLRVLSFYGGSRPKLAEVVASYDVVITSYGVVTSEGNMATNRRDKILAEKPWQYAGRTAPEYKSCLQRINWHRVLLDEGMYTIIL